MTLNRDIDLKKGEVITRSFISKKQSLEIEELK